MFDPEKVRRSSISVYKEIPQRIDGNDVVLASDYDQLLERHRALEKYLDDNFVHVPQHLWSRRRVASVAAEQQAHLGTQRMYGYDPTAP